LPFYLLNLHTVDFVMGILGLRLIVIGFFGVFDGFYMKFSIFLYFCCKIQSILQHLHPKTHLQFLRYIQRSRKVNQFLLSCIVAIYFTIIVFIHNKAPIAIKTNRNIFHKKKSFLIFCTITAIFFLPAFMMLMLNCKMCRMWNMWLHIFMCMYMLLRITI